MSRCNAAFKKDIRLKCYDALERNGFTRFAKEGVDWPLDGGFHCWVGLNTGLYSDRVEINPFVGVHVVPIAKLRAALEGCKYDRGIATYAIPMGEILSVRNERAFAFTPEQSDSFVASEAQRLAGLYANAGLAYARSIASYEALLPLLEGRVEMLGGYPERVACCLYLMGEIGRARAFVGGFLAREPDYFDSFAGPFLSMIDAEEVGGKAPFGVTAR